MSNLHKTVFVFVLLTLAAVQTSCGFHLRGAVSLPDQITPLFLDLSAVDNSLGRELQILLSSSGENALAGLKSEAKTILKITNLKNKQRVVAVDDLGRAREYELNYQFHYELKKVAEVGESSEIIKTNTVKLKRDWFFDPDSVLAVAHEKESLLDDMRKDAARVTLRQLAAIKK